jgi:hypothetical protein
MGKQDADARPSGEEKQSEYPKADRRRPDKERKVWVEVYPGGDCHIELGRMNADEQYLQSGEAKALRDLLNEMLPEDEDEQ